MANYKSSAFWVASTQELVDNFYFDETDEDGLFMFVGNNQEQSLYVWRKQGIAENPKDIPVNLGCWKFFSSTQKTTIYDIASWSSIQNLLYNGLSQNRFDLKPYKTVSWQDIVIKMIPIINANEIAEENYIQNNANRELLTHFAYIYNLRFNQSYENQKLIPDEDNSLSNWEFIKTILNAATLKNRNSYVVKEDNNFSSLDNTTLALQVQHIKLNALRIQLSEYDVHSLCDFNVINLSMKKAVDNNRRIDFINTESLLTNWVYIRSLR